MNFIHYVCPFENLIWLVISFSNFTEDIKIWFLIYKIHLNRYEMSLEAFFFSRFTSGKKFDFTIPFWSINSCNMIESVSLIVLQIIKYSTKIHQNREMIVATKIYKRSKLRAYFTMAGHAYDTNKKNHILVSLA